MSTRLLRSMPGDIEICRKKLAGWCVMDRHIGNIVVARRLYIVNFEIKVSHYNYSATLQDQRTLPYKRYFATTDMPTSRGGHALATEHHSPQPRKQISTNSTYHCEKSKSRTSTMSTKLVNGRERKMRHAVYTAASLLFSRHRNFTSLE